MNRLFPRVYDRRRQRRPNSHRPRFEVLEDRRVPSTVTNLSDAGAGSLRQAILDTPAGGTIDFQPGLSGTIALNSGELMIAEDLTIAGPGPTVSGNDSSRVLEIAANFTVDISGLTIADGRPPELTARGGGILNAGTLNLIDCLLSGNSVYGLSPGGGGGIYNQSGTLTVTNSTLSANSAHFINSLGAGGGGIFNSAGTVSITNSILSGNSAFGGGGIYNVSGGALTITNSILSGNFTTSSGAGGGISSTYGTLTITNSTLSGNSGYRGGAISSDTGTVTITGSTISGNSASNYAGGGIDNTAGMVSVTDSILSGNSVSSAGGVGGAVSNMSGMLTVTGSTLSGNSADYGGGIYNGGSTSTISNCTLSGNSADYGGGIYNGGSTSFTSTLTVTSSTLSGNSATTNGGGIYTVAVFASTAPRSTLLAGNIAPSSPDLFGTLSSQGHNLIGDGTGGGGYDPTDLVGTSDNPIDPKLGPLQDNGGPTQTTALLPGSPALNAGDPDQLGSTDQRGVVRSGAVNIGAYQASATSFVVTAPDAAQAGVPFDVTVSAVDPFGQAAVGYTGTVTFGTTDTGPGVVLPADYAFTAADAGMHTFSDTGLGETTLITAGPQTLTVTDTSDGTITGSATVTVTGPDIVRPAPSPVVPSASALAAMDLFFAARHPEQPGLALW